MKINIVNCHSQDQIIILNFPLKPILQITLGQVRFWQNLRYFAYLHKLKCAFYLNIKRDYITSREWHFGESFKNYFLGS